MIFITAIVAFIAHFILLVLGNEGMLPISIYDKDHYVNPLSAIYTPFTIILLYEIFLLIYYLPKSITIYLGKQYEIITLIMIRKIFEDLSYFPEYIGAEDKGAVINLLLTFAGLILLFLFIFLYYKLSGDKKERKQCKSRTELTFVASKKVLAMGLLLLFVFLFVKSLFDLKDLTLTIENSVYALKTINNMFFSDFFTALILTEVLLLLLTFNLSDKFNKVVRNSGFIISTILLKMSFMAEGLTNVIIVLVAIVFGITILGIHRLFEKKLNG
ncbi:hypothetical protein LJC57_03940 [Parabacteroides sp. OttesenSCG-928-G07]|nr:hypothetical protein [Parabacteroides sp. OttesenSCG-928-G21]MDL2277722.1 hypothetical protein [Parabacteroides sp. OttesenSCG-928-G07]